MQRGSSRPASRLVALFRGRRLLGGPSPARVGAQDAAGPRPPAAAGAAPAGPPRPPQYVSPEVATDGSITFRIHAPNAQAVRVSAGDIQGLAQGASQMTKGAERHLGGHAGSDRCPAATATTSTSTACATIDPRNPSTSESNTNTWSVVHVPGRPVHGHDRRAARRRRQRAPTGRPRSASSGGCTSTRRPDTRRGNEKYPVFYLLHGAGDSDDSWTHGRPRRLHPRQPDRREARPSR